MLKHCKQDIPSMSDVTAAHAKQIKAMRITAAANAAEAAEASERNRQNSAAAGKRQRLQPAQSSVLDAREQPTHSTRVRTKVKPFTYGAKSDEDTKKKKEAGDKAKKKDESDKKKRKSSASSAEVKAEDSNVSVTNKKAKTGKTTFACPFTRCTYRAALRSGTPPPTYPQSQRWLLACHCAAVRVSSVLSRYCHTADAPMCVAPHRGYRVWLPCTVA